MTLTESSNNLLSRRNFLGFRFKLKGSGGSSGGSNSSNTPKQVFSQPEIIHNYGNVSPSIPRQAINPAVHPLLSKPIAREENFVLLPNRHSSMKRKRDPNSPVRSSIKPKPREEGLNEWSRYLSSYAEGRFNMSNPPEPPENRPSGHMKPPIPPNDKERVEALHKYYDVVRPDTATTPTSPTTRAQIDRFQRLIVTARQTFQTKVALLSLVDEKRQFFKCEVGLGLNPDTDREITFCGHTILSNEPMVVLNAEKDWRLASNPLVTGWPYIRFYAGAPIITPNGHAIGTVCVVDTEPRDSFDVNQRRRLTEFARLAMDEIELAMRSRASKASKNRDGSVQTDPAKEVPSALRGMTAVASEAGTINAAIAGKDIHKGVDFLDELDVVETATTLADKGGLAQLKFKYGRNTASEIEEGAKGVEKAGRKMGEPKRPGKTVKVASPVHSRRPSYIKSKGPEPSSYHDPTKGKRSMKPTHRQNPSDQAPKPSIRPKSSLRHQSYDSSNLGAASDSECPVKHLAVPVTPRNVEQDSKTSSLEHNPLTFKDDEKDQKGSTIPVTPAMPTYFDLQTKSNPELAAQLIARALRVDFVYFMRLTPITAKHPNHTGYPNSEVNMELLGSYGLPFPALSFSPFTHLEALRSELGMIYYSQKSEEEGNTSDDSLANAKDFFKVGIVVPVWREYPRSSLTSSTASTKARAGSSKDSSIGRQGSIGSTETSTTIASLRENCRKGVVVGVFSKRGERKTFTRIEREYLKEWVSLRDHL